MTVPAFAPCQGALRYVAELPAPLEAHQFGCVNVQVKGRDGAFVPFGSFALTLGSDSCGATSPLATFRTGVASATVREWDATTGCFSPSERQTRIGFEPSPGFVGNQDLVTVELCDFCL
jgi:hypothetical protein